MRSIRTCGAVLVAVLLLGCGDDDDSAPVTVTVPPESTTVTTTEASPPPTTEVESTPTVQATTTVAPTTTIDEIAATKSAVAAAIVQSRQDYLYAVRNYDAPDALDVLARTTVRDGPSWQLGIQNIETLRSNGWRTRANPDVPSDLIVEGEVELLDGPPATRATVVSCTISAGVVYEPGAGPGGTDTIVNDEVVARRGRSTLVIDGGTWKLLEGESLGEWSGATTCPPA